MNKRIVAASVIFVSAVALSGCAKQVDAGATNAESVPGVGNLSRFCDGPVLIYYSDWDASDDQYEWFWPGGCEFDGNRWSFADKPVSADAVIPNGDSTEDGDDDD